MDTRFLSVLTGNPRGDTPFYWTHQDQLETRTAGYQIPTISSGCLLIKYSPFSCSFLTRSVIALETTYDDCQPQDRAGAKWLGMSVRNSCENLG